MTVDARESGHGSLSSNLASHRCSRKTYFVAGPHRTSERPHPIDRTVGRALRNRSRRLRVNILFRPSATPLPRPKQPSRLSIGSLTIKVTGCFSWGTTIGVAAARSGEALGRGVFRSASLTLRPRRREYSRRSVGKPTNEVRHFSENRQTRKVID